MEFTGERFMPGIENEELTTEHMQRYVSVLPLVKGKVVVDIASGEGYGTNILAEEAATIIGLDICEEAVENASQKYVRENLKYAVGDVAKIPLEDNSVDVIVSFETIEHVDEENQKKFLKEAKRILRKDGILVISTPNKEIYSDKYNYHNEFHIKEFYKQEFINFIQTEFNNYELYNQYDEVVNVIEGISPGKKAVLFKPEEREGKYYIAVASNAQIPNMNQVITVRKKEEYSRCLDRIIELQNGEIERNEHIEKLDKEIIKRDSLIQQLQKGEEERNRHIGKLDNEIAHLNRNLENKEQELQQITEREHKNSEKNRVFIEGLEKRITILQESEEERNLHIRKLDTEIEEKNILIDQLRQSEEERNIRIKKQDDEIAQLNISLEEKVREINELMENEHWKSEIGQDYIASLKQNILELQEAISDREQKIADLQKNLEEKNEKITDLRVEVEQHKAFVAHLENRLESETKSRNEKNQKIIELQEAVQKYSETILNQKEELFRQAVQMSELQKDIEELSKAKEKNEEEIASLAQEKRVQQNSLNDINMEYRLLQNAMRQSEEEQKKLEEKLAQMIAENQSLQTSLAELNVDKIALAESLEKLKTEKQELQLAYEENSATQDNEVVEELRESLNIVNNEKQALQDLYDEICVSKQELQENFDRVCTEKQYIHEYGEKVNDEKDRLKERVSELEQELRNKQGHIELLLESDRELERLKAQDDKRLVNRIFPKASKRRLFVKLAYKCVRHPFKTLKMIFTKGKVKNFFRFLKKDGVIFVDTLIDDNYRGTAVKKQELVVSKVERTKDISEYQPLTFPKQKKPQVSIVIPVYNQFEYTYNCLKSILNNSGDITYEIIIANDCSTDLTTRISEVVKNIKVVTNKENLRFLKNCNNAAKYANGRYILFLNNDTQVQPNWLAPLVELIERDGTIGMVGSKLVYADGTLQEAGGILWKDGSAWNYGNRRDPADPEYNYVKEADYISGAAIMIKADLWKEIGGFDETFAPAYCEDSDLAFEVRKHGYKVMYQPLSVVVHFEGISNGTDTSSGQKAYQVINQKKFMEKWKDVLEEEHFPNAESVFVARDRNRNKRTLLMVDHYVPQFDKDAGSRTVYQYLRLFVKQGYNVKFIGDNYFRHEPYTTVLQQMGVEVLYGPYYANNWETWIKENAEHFDFVFLNRPHISVKYIDFIRKHTNAKIIYYGHDLHFLREKRRYELEQDPQALKNSKEWKQKELALMKQADMTYYPSSIEVKEIAKIDASIKAKAIVAYMFEDVVVQPYDFNGRKDIMFVGGFTHTPNVDAVKWFVKEILPMVLDKLPDLKFYIMGSNPPESILNLASDNVVVKGFVTDEELEWHYQNCRISVVPLRYGAGIKGKVVEAMRYGMPVVTTSVGAEGITGAEKILCVGNKAKAIARDLVALYSDKNALRDMSARSYEYIKKNFSMESAWSVIEEDFK